MDDKEWLAALNLSYMKGVGSKSIMKLLEYCGTAAGILELGETEIRQLLGKRPADAFLKEKVWLEEAKVTGKYQQICRERRNTLEEGQIKFVPFTHQNYPEKLKHIPNPPFALFVKGRLPKENVPSIAMIGARACSEYGKRVAYDFGKQFGAMGIQIIIGMAMGIDGISQRGVLEGGGETYGVLGCGVDVCYPKENIQLYGDIISSGGIISEYLPGTLAQSMLFPARNRIISGLADAILVIEARKRSGTYITVTQALEQGKEVYAVPGRITDGLSEGCNYLISQGAGVATAPEDILKDFSCLIPNVTIGNTWETADKEEMKYIDDEQKFLLSCLDITPVSINELYRKVVKRKHITLPELMLQITKLQIMGIVIGEGDYYRLRS